MKELGLQQVPVAEIDTVGRLRQVDGQMAAALAENIVQVGRLRQPVEVRQVKGGGGYQLIAGAHRLAAVQRLGWETIPAFVYEATDDEARLAEIDENLVRHELNPLDRATFLAERKDVYERLHPETKRGVAGGKARQGTASDTMSFAEETAQRLGLTDRTIQRAVKIAIGLAPDVRKTISGTWIAQSQSELLALSAMSPFEQRAVTAILLAPEAKTKKAKQALREVQGHRADEKPAAEGHAKLMDAWRKADPAARAAFVAWLAERGHLPANDAEKAA